MLKRLKFLWDSIRSKEYVIVYNPEFKDNRYSLFQGCTCINVFNTLDGAKQCMQSRIDADKGRCYFRYDSDGNFIDKQKHF